MEIKILNVKKTKKVIFKTYHLKIRCGKRLYPTDSVEYLGVKVDANLSWKCQVNDLSIKLNRANALPFKIRKCVSSKILRSIYFALFESHLSYCSLAWS